MESRRKGETGKEGRGGEERKGVSRAREPRSPPEIKDTNFLALSRRAGSGLGDKYAWLRYRSHDDAPSDNADEYVPRTLRVSLPWPRLFLRGGDGGGQERITRPKGGTRHRCADVSSI